MKPMIVNLNTREWLVPTVVDWCHGEFASPSTPRDSVDAAVRENAGEKPYPFCLVAIVPGNDGAPETPVGCVHGVESELDERPDLEPFIAALYVHPAHRGLGIGNLLLAAAERQCAIAGFDAAYLCAWSRPEWYQRRGWRVIDPNAGARRTPLMTKPVG